jgi:hypothetical protein
VVGGELHLPALRRAHERRGHDAGVVDQDVQRAVPPGRERRDGGLVGEIERRDQDLLVAGAVDDVLRGALAGLEVADRQGHLGARAGQGARRLDADAGRAAGDDGAAAGEVDPFDYLSRGRLGAEGGGDAIGHDTSRLGRLESEVPPVS